jgi:hypothetical protein
MIAAVGGLQPGQSLGINTHPEEREISDMPMDFAARFSLPLFRLEHHPGYIFQTSADDAAEAVQGIAADESQQHVGQIVGQSRIGNAQIHLKSMLSQSGEHVPQSFGLSDNCDHFPSPKASLSFQNRHINSMAAFPPSSNRF